MHDEPDSELELTSALVPLFVIAKGRALPADHEYEHTTLVTWNIEGLARSRGVRYEHLEAELAAFLRHETGYGSPPVWTAAGCFGTWAVDDLRT